MSNNPGWFWLLAWTQDFKSTSRQIFKSSIFLAFCCTFTTPNNQVFWKDENRNIVFCQNWISLSLSINFRFICAYPNFDTAGTSTFPSAPCCYGDEQYGDGSVDGSYTLTAVENGKENVYGKSRKGGKKHSCYRKKLWRQDSSWISKVWAKRTTSWVRLVEH